MTNSQILSIFGNYLGHYMLKGQVDQESCRLYPQVGIGSFPLSDRHGPNWYDLYLFNATVCRCLVTLSNKDALVIS